MGTWGEFMEFNGVIEKINSVKKLTNLKMLLKELKKAQTTAG
jgi:hypothetical protein